MLIKSAVLACVLAAAASGCRGDRNEGAVEYGRPGEATEPGVQGTYGTGAAPNASQDTTRTDEAGHTVHETGADRPMEQGTGADVQGQTDAGVPRGTNRGAMRPRDVTSPTSQTAAGTGTTTDTGINTENAGTGGTDDPTR